MNFIHPEHQYLYETAKEALRRNPGYPILEVGCFKGESTKALAQAAKEENVKLFCVDPFFDHYDAGLRLALVDKETGFEAESSFVDFKRNLRDYEDTVISIATTFNVADTACIFNKFAFIHIDGLHDEESVKHDAKAARNLLIPSSLSFYGVGGTILFHDGTWASVSKPVKEVFPNA